MSIYKNSVVFSLYIDIPKEKLDAQPPHFGETEDKNLKAKREFAKHAEWLIQTQKNYAKSIGADYYIFTYDDEYVEYAKSLPAVITEYNVVNFYKIKKLYDLSETYDNILYLDLDAIPITKQNFFDRWKGLTIKSGVAESQREIGIGEQALKRLSRHVQKHSNRSPTAKYWNAQSMLVNKGISAKNVEVFNTGIIGANKKSLEELDYFGSFEKDLEYMTWCKNEPDIYPPFIQELFGWDNETLWAYKMISNNVEYNKLSPSWHHFMDKYSYIPKGTKIVHCIKKDFDFVKNYIQSV